MSISEKIRQAGYIIPKDTSKASLLYFLDLGSIPIVKITRKRLFHPYVETIVCIKPSKTGEFYPDVIDITPLSRKDIRKVLKVYRTNSSFPEIFISRMVLFPNYEY